MTRILIVRLGSLGDLVHAVPAVSALRRAHPSAEIDWLVDAAHREFLEMVPAVSSIVALGGRTIGAWLEARRALRSRAYDVALDFQGLVKSAVLARLSGARRVAGFDRRSLRERGAALFYTERVDVGDRIDESQHVIEKNLRLAARFGAATGPVEFPLAVQESPAIAAFRARLSGEYALINPGAAWPNKRWPVAAFGRVAAGLFERHRCRSAVLWGPGDSALADEVVAASAGAAVAAPATRLADVAALSRHARLFLSGDTGPLHIAAAMGTPVVALFGPTNPRRNGPWDPDDISISRYAACDCHYERRCRRTSGWCLGTISVDEVMAATERRLRDGGGRVAASGGHEAGPRP